MENLLMFIYLAVLVTLFTAGKNWFRGRKLREENRRRNLEDLAENGPYHERKKMSIVRLKQ